MPADYQIIGGGLIGLSTAYALLERGAGHVRIIEAREEVALETSFANAGMVHASLARPWNEPGIALKILKQLLGGDTAMRLSLRALPSLAMWAPEFLRNSSYKNHWGATQHNYALARYSLRLNQEWRDKLDIQDNYSGRGLLKIFRTEKEFGAAKTHSNILQEWGLETHFLNPAQAADKEPALAQVTGALAGALYYPNDFKADAYLFCKALEREVIRLGGTLETGTKSLGFIKKDGGIIGVETGKGERLARNTVVAAGARSYQLLRPLGIKLPLRPVKGYSLSFQLGIDQACTPTIPVVDEGLHVAITPLGHQIRIAGMAELSGFNGSIPRRRMHSLFNMLGDVYPDIAKNLVLEDGAQWHGFRPVSAYGVPLIGRAPIKGLSVNTGHGHMGWTFCAGAGALMADILLDRRAAIEAGAFSLLKSNN